MREDLNMRRKGLIPSQFYRYLANGYNFQIHDIYFINELIAHDHYISVTNYKSRYRRFDLKGGLIIPDSIHLQIHQEDKTIRVLIENDVDPNFLDTCKLFSTALFTTPRVHKYLALYKVYESLTEKNERNLTFSAIRHSLAHSTKSLTRPNVVQKLNELLGGVVIEPDSYRHKKVLFVAYWDMLIETDKLLAKKTIDFIQSSSSYLGTFRLVTSVKKTKPEPYK